MRTVHVSRVPAMVVMNQPEHGVMRSGTGQLANIDRVVFPTESLHTESLQLRSVEKDNTLRFPLY